MTLVRHPAWEEWEAAHPDTIIVEWWPGKQRGEVADAVQWDWEAALWMHVHGYEVQRISMGWLPGAFPVTHWAYPYEGNEWYRYLFPEAYIEVDDIDEERLEVDPAINPLDLIAYYERTKVSMQPQVEVPNGAY